MPKPRKAARVLKWRGQWTLFYFDHLAGKQKRVSCEGLGAATGSERAELARIYRLRERNEAAEVMRRGGLLAYDTPLIAALDRYLANLAKRVDTRAACPEGRAGVAANTGRESRDSVERFQAWLSERGRHRMTTGDLDAPTISAWLDGLRGSPRTRNKHGRHLRGAVYWLADLRPPMFPDADGLRRAFKPIRADAPAPKCHCPAELRALLVAALERESGDYKVQVTRLKGGKVERYEQTASTAPSVPLSRLVLLLALSGARRGEVLALRWQDCNLGRGRLTFRSQKTGSARITPLTGAPEGDVAPRLLTLLKRWRMEAGGREWVLPHDEPDPPVWPEAAWRGLLRAAEVNVRPQGLRQTFCAVAASMGVPASVAAQWQGHGAAVAEKWYRSLSLERPAGAVDFEQALGLAELIDGMLPKQKRAKVSGR